MNSESILSENVLKEKLTAEQYNILRNRGTEPAFSGKYLKNKDKGTYLCAACGNELFLSEAKFDSGKRKSQTGDRKAKI